MTAEALDYLSTPSPGAEELATLLSIAVQIEPALIRAIRLGLAPRRDVSAEADLWFSDWVGVRGSDSIRLRDDIVPALRERLVARLAADPADPAWQLWDLVARVHAGRSAALLLEEHLTWTAVRAMAGDSTAPDLDEALRPALRAVVLEGRTGVSEWFAGAWHRLPGPVRGTVTAWQLLQTSADASSASDIAPETYLDLADVYTLGSCIPDTEILVRHDGTNLVLNDHGADGNHLITVPDTRPRVLQLRQPTIQGPQRQTLRIDPDHVESVPVGDSTVWVQTGRGTIYEISPSPADPQHPAATHTVDLAFRTASAGAKPRTSPDGTASNDADELRQRCRDVRSRTLPVDDALVERIESEVADYRRYLDGSPALPPGELAERLPLMGWLIYEASLIAVQRTEAGYESMEPDRRRLSDESVRLVARLADAARALPWPQHAPRALGAVRAQALAAAKRDTEVGYDQAFILLEEARAKLEAFRASVGNLPSAVLPVDEMQVQLSLAEIGIACRTAEAGLGHWAEHHPEDATEVAAQWALRMYRNLSHALETGMAIRDQLARIQHEYGFVYAVDEYRLTLVTSLQNPAILAARIALVLLVLSHSAEQLGEQPEGGEMTWQQYRQVLVDRFVTFNSEIERPVFGRDGVPHKPTQATIRSIVQLRLMFALLATGITLASDMDADPVLARHRLDDEAVEALSAWLAGTGDGGRRGDAGIIGTATMPFFIDAVERSRAEFGVRSGYREWRRRWFVLDRYANEPGRRERVEVLLHGAVSTASPLDAAPDEPSATEVEPARRPAGTLSDPVRRALARDDLLQLAADADRALGVVRQREALARTARRDHSPWQVAVDHYLRLADSDEEWAVRGQALSHAATIIRFCTLAGIALHTGEDPADLYARALQERPVQRVRSDKRSTDAMTLDVIVAHRAARERRLRGEHVDRHQFGGQISDFLLGTGTEPYRDRILYEIGASLLMAGSADQVADALRDADYQNQDTLRTQFFSRHRQDFVLALSAWQQGDDPEASQRLAASLDQVRGRLEDIVHELSATLSLAEHIATRGDVRRAVNLAREALTVVERLGSRGSIVAAASGPLFLALQRVRGDIALLASQLPGPQAAELGMSVCISAKRNGTANLLRTGRSALNPQTKGLLDEIVSVETLGVPESEEVDSGAKLSRLRAELAQAVSPMLADTVLPARTDTRSMIHNVGSRYAVDYAALPDSVNHRPSWFRSTIYPGGPVEFDQLASTEHLQSLFAGGTQHRNGATKSAMNYMSVDWFALGVELLPAGLRRQLHSATRDRPLEVVISPHAGLYHVPWVALAIDVRGTRLIERAVVVQTPTLATLAGASAPIVAGPALVQLVGRAESGVDIREEQAAWGLVNEPDGRAPLAECSVPAGPPAIPVPDNSLSEALARRPDGWQFVHIAAHCSGRGFFQTLELPEPLSAAQAMTLRWPPSVLMSSCFVAPLSDETGLDQFSFTIALLSGGSRCVVTGVHEMPDAIVGHIAAAIVSQVLSSPTSLPIALRNAQLAALAVGRRIIDWAPFVAYTRD